MEGKVLNYKLAWVDESNSSNLNSQMFDTVEEAIKESDAKKNFLIFSLKKMDGDKYSWDLLPYGDYAYMKTGLWVKKFWSEYKGWICVGLGFIVAYKIGFSLDKSKK